MDLSRDISSRNANAPVSSNAPANNRRGRSSDSKWGRIAVIVAVTVLAILLIAIIAVAATGKNDKTEASYVDTSKLQAVFLNTGQVYFGNVKSLNGKYLTLTNIYYLQTTSNGSGQQQQNTGVTLVKLGCELHEPNDLMVINRDQVTFWENLQDGGQVAKAVADFKQKNPQGQKCADQSSSSSTNSTNSTQNATTNNKQ